ncbi:hypothetical protein [Christiangramia forsetii]|uniref:Membrane protein n=2 Tax=Christiangramia forsetii TaxID=411153 RepID=A0M5L7_CHRFK|nr:hypothetical protein [Christiangramia forsetii]GGG32635.1 hypothetical protein GCM10011532_15280 [Christiangramia forsetii]CAL67912.1 membrane protein [Christiangramia forsetii KT0803]
MIKQNVVTGFLTGIAANIAGVILYITLLSDAELDIALKDALVNDYLGKIIALGAVLNFLPFFVFLKKKQNYHARGVLLATVSVAVAVAIFKFF